MAACGRLIAVPPSTSADLACWHTLLPAMHMLLSTGATPAEDLVTLAGCLVSGAMPQLHMFARKPPALRSVPGSLDAAAIDSVHLVQVRGGWPTASCVQFEWSHR